MFVVSSFTISSLQLLVSWRHLGHQENLAGVAQFGCARRVFSILHIACGVLLYARAAAQNLYNSSEVKNIRQASAKDTMYITAFCPTLRIGKGPVCQSCLLR